MAGNAHQPPGARESEGANDPAAATTTTDRATDAREAARPISPARADAILRDLHRQIRVLAAYLGAGASIAIAWLIYLMQAIFDIDIVPHRSATAGRTDPRHLLVFAIIVTALAIAWAIRAARKARRLAARGVQTTGRIESIAPVTKHGASPMTISYTTAAGERRQARIDLPAEHYAVGQFVTILYDPDRPGDCEVH